MFDVIIAAGGFSARMKGAKNKLLLNIHGRSVLENCILPFLKIQGLNKIIIATSLELFEEVNSLSKLMSSKILVTLGGASRTETVKKALKLVESEIVLIHDGARPFVTVDIIERVLESTKKTGGAIPTIPLEDSIISINQGIRSACRDNFAKIQTPQGFNTKKIITAYNQTSGNFSDDSAVYIAYYDTISKVDGAKYNRKITTFDDLLVPECRTGIGFDTHMLVSGRKLILGGIDIPHKLGLLGHSDADVLTHAIMDAILSALGERDIGVQFPDDNKKFKDISSLVLLDSVLDMVKKANMKINNLSAVIIAEKPKLKNYIPLINNIFQEKLNITVDQIGISATTAEGFGSIGKELAISALATVSLIKVH